MKRILLVNSNTEILPYPVAPLGISLIASSVGDSFKVKIFDSAFNSTNDLINFANEFKPDYIGIGLRNIDNVTMRKCKFYIEEIKEKIIKPLKNNFKAPLILGGSGFSIAPTELFDFFDVDYGIIGEGEHAFRELISELEKGNKHIHHEQILTKDKNSYTAIQYASKPLNIPRANIDKFIDFSPYSKRGNYPIQTKRGCSHKCIYCSYPNIEGRKYRLRPVMDIVDEIEEVSKRIPGTPFEFVDSTFNSPLEHALDICKEISKRNLNLSLRTMGVNPGDITEELILEMQKAGFAQIDCTPDSASELILKNYRKNFTKNKLKESARIIQKYDMPTMWFFMMGAPGETKETILETFEFIDNYISDDDMVHITEGIRIIPNTELYSIALHEGVISKDMNPIEPMFYVSPEIGKTKLSEILEAEIAKRNNVVNSINTAPSPELMEAAISYRQKNKTNEPMFRTLLKVQAQIVKAQGIATQNEYQDKRGTKRQKTKGKR